MVLFVLNLWGRTVGIEFVDRAGKSKIKLSLCCTFFCFLSCEMSMSWEVGHILTNILEGIIKPFGYLMKFWTVLLVVYRPDGLETFLVDDISKYQVFFCCDLYMFVSLALICSCCICCICSCCFYHSVEGQQMMMMIRVLATPGRAAREGLGGPVLLLAKKIKNNKYFVCIFLHFFFKKWFFHHEKSKNDFFLGGDTPSLFPNPLCSLKVATLVSTIPHVR